MDLKGENDFDLIDVAQAFTFVGGVAIDRFEHDELSRQSLQGGPRIFGVGRCMNTGDNLDVIERARKLFDEVIVAVAHNDEKQPLFPLAERLDLLRETAGKINNVRIAQFKGLLVEFAKAEKAGAVIRGLRAVSDFEFEFQMALMNRKLDVGVETIFLMPKEEYTYLSSRIVKEIARLGGDVSSFVPVCVVKALSRKFKR